MSDDERERLAHNILVYTQGFVNGNVSGSSDYKGYFLSLVSAYEGIDEADLRGNLQVFSR